MKKVKKFGFSPVIIGLVQAVGLLAYIAGIGWLMLNSNRWFGPKPNVLGPMLFLALFVFSAILSTAVILGYPFYLVWEKKDLKTAFKIVVSSAAFLLVFIIAAALVLIR